jgi:uncharacterized protein with ATP-grasp and redox domains
MKNGIGLRLSLPRTCIELLKKATGNTSPFSQLKTKYDYVALEHYPKLKLIVENSKDSLLAAAKVAITGNVTDFGPKVDINLKQDVEDVLSNDLAINYVDKLKESISGPTKVLYLADNAEETVFNKILVEELLKQNVEVRTLCRQIFFFSVICTMWEEMLSSCYSTGNGTMIPSKALSIKRTTAESTLLFLRK